MRFASALVAAVPLALVGCNSPEADACFVDGARQTYDGTSAYVASVQPDGAGAGYFGSETTLLVVDDFSPEHVDLRGNSVCEDRGRTTFAVHVGDCTLRATTQSISYDSGNYSSHHFIAATSAIEPGATCVLPVTGGTATILVHDGTLTTKPDSIELTLGGDVVDWLGHPPTSGHLDFRFDGNVVAHP